MVVFVYSPGRMKWPYNNTIVAGNFNGTGSNPSDISSSVLIAANSFNNLTGTGGSADLTNGTNGNQTNVANPGLGPLANNANALTKTHALLLGSPALDGGNNQRAIDAGLTSDQRGQPFARFVDGPDDRRHRHGGYRRLRSAGLGRSHSG